MANPDTWISYIEAFVDTSRPPVQQDASVDAIAALVKNDLLTLETLVREMGLYLTTTDHIIRARGTLFLGEILSRLTLKTLNSATIRSLVGFFTSRLEDWQALRGTLVGCLALLRRKSNVGMVMGSEARMLAETYLASVQAQSLAVHDRKLCFEVLQCLLDVYPEALTTLADELIYGILDAIDGEKDPRCLMLTFHIAETFMRKFPDQSKLGASFATEVFEILGRYFPIYFTHQQSDDFEITRDDLSRALMNAFCSTPYFEPLAVPLLLDKLSSSLPLAKSDSLKYLSNCILHYGADTMLKHAKTIWSALKDVIFDLSSQQIIFSSNSGSAADVESQERRIVKEALACLQMATSQLNHSDSEPFISLILNDHDIERKLESVCLELRYSGISEESRRQLNAIGSILSCVSKVSIDCCSRAFQKLFPRLMKVLGVLMRDAVDICITDGKSYSNILNFGALYLCVELLTSCRDLAMIAEDCSQVPDSWWYILKDFSGPLMYALRSALLNGGTHANTGPEHMFCIVKALQSLATFPGHSSPVSDELYEEIFSVLMSAITGQYDDTVLWRTALEALVQIGLHVDKIHDSKKKMSYNRLVVERSISLLSCDITMSLPLKLETISKIGATGPGFISTVIRGLEEAIFSNFFDSCVNNNLGVAEIIVSQLDCYSSQMLPCCDKFGKVDEVAMQFATNIWNLMDKHSAISVNLRRQGVLDATMLTMKLTVGYCSAENQGTLVRKAYNIVTSVTSFPSDSLLLPLSNLKTLQHFPDISSLSCKDEYLLSLFASQMTALRPETPIPDTRVLIRLFTVLLLKGHLPAAQALASMVNKWPADRRAESSNADELEKGINVVLETLFTVISTSALDEHKIVSGIGDSYKSIQIKAIVGLAWIGKGLLMRGHEKIKEIAMFLLKYLLSNQNVISTSEPMQEFEKGNDQGLQTLVTRSAADAFHVLLFDSETCLNKKFHAKIRPLYKQRFYSTMMPILLSSIKETNSLSIRAVLYRAIGHIFSDSPVAAIVAEAKRVVPPLLECLSISSLEALNKELTYNLLLVLSGILMHENGKEAIIENAHIIISHLIRLISYPHMTLVRETAIQCLTAMLALPHTRIYPMRPQVLRALALSLDDHKRVVRQEAVRCRQAWASIASRSLHF